MKKGKKHTSCDRNFLTCLISHFCQCISQQEANLPLIPMLLKDFLDDLLKLHFSNIRDRGLCLRIMTFRINGSRDGVSMMRIIIILSGIYSAVKRHLELLLYEQTSCLKHKKYKKWRFWRFEFSTFLSKLRIDEKSTVISKSDYFL